MRICVVVRRLGGSRSWEQGLRVVFEPGRPVVVLSGEFAPGAELMALSTVPGGVATQVLAYPREEGPDNLGWPHSRGGVGEGAGFP